MSVKIPVAIREKTENKKNTMFATIVLKVSQSSGKCIAAQKNAFKNG